MYIQFFALTLKYKVLLELKTVVMESRNFITSEEFFSASLVRRVLFGLALGFVIISFFVFGVDSPNPDWGEYWRIRPLIVTPMAGAAAGLFYHFMEPMRRMGGWKKAAAIVLCVLVYFVGLWMGIVLGLDGTMWN